MAGSSGATARSMSSCTRRRLRASPFRPAYPGVTRGTCFVESSGGAVAGKRDGDSGFSPVGRDRAEDRRHGQVAVGTANRCVQLTEHRDLPGECLEFRFHETSGSIPLALTDGAAGGEPCERLYLIKPEAEVLERQRRRDVPAVLAGIHPGAAG